MNTSTLSAAIRLAAIFLWLGVSTTQAVLVDVQPDDGDRTIIKNISEAMDQITPYEPILLSQDDVDGTNTLSIDTSGKYKLSGSIVGKIFIDVDKVELDLNGYLVKATTSSHAIEVNNYRKQIKIFNGRISDASTTGYGGVRIRTGCSLIIVENVNIFNCYYGLVPFGDSGAGETIKDCVFKDFVCDGCAIGVNLGYVDRSYVLNGLVLNGIENGFSFWLRDSSYNVIENCTVNSGIVLIGFYIKGSCNILRKCVVKNIVSDIYTYGIYLFLADDNKIIDCLINTVKSTDPSSDAIGIYVAGGNDNLILRNKIFNCKTGLHADDANIFSTQGNIAIQNVAYNNGTNYNNVPNVQTYDPTSSTDNTTLLDNVDVQ